MGEKKENAAAEKKKGDDGKRKEDKKDKNGGAVVLKIDMHCEGCASKIMKYAKSVQGVEKVNVEWEASKLTVEGKVDPSKLRETLQEKTKKKVELVSPQLPKKDKDNKADDDNNSDKGKGKNNNGNAKNNKTQEKNPEEKKPKEPVLTTAVLKLGLHCHGCVEKIQKLVSKTTGVQIVTVEMQKDLVTVTGTMDVAALVERLKTKMKRVVEVVPQKKEKESKEVKEKGKEKDKDKEKEKGKEEKEKEKEGGDGEGNEKEGVGGNGNGVGGKKKKKGGGGGGEGGGKEAKYEPGGDDGGGKLVEGNRMEYFGPPGFVNTTVGYYGYGNPPLPGNGFGHGNANGALSYYGNPIPYPGYNYVSGYGPMYGDPCHAPQMFSDENPNACSVM